MKERKGKQETNEWKNPKKRKKKDLACAWNYMQGIFMYK